MLVDVNVISSNRERVVVLLLQIFYGRAHTNILQRHRNLRIG